MIYLDNAATSGIKPSGVINAVNTALTKYVANPGRGGHTRSMDTAYMIYSVRQKAMEFFGAESAENVVFTQNCTHSANCVIKGVLEKNDHIIISDLEHNAVMRPLFEMNKSGVKFSVAKTYVGDDKATVKSFEELITDKTKMIMCTHASNVFGCILPIEKIGELCKKHGLIFAVDGAQTAGVIDINMKKMNIDFLCIAPHKGLYAPMGTGMLIARKPLKNTVIQGGTGSNSFSMFQPAEMPDRIESGTVNVAGICGIGAGIDFVKRKGISNIYKSEFLLCKYLFDKLKKMPNIILYSDDYLPSKTVPVLSFNIKNMNSEDTAALLNKNGIAVRAGFHCAPTAHIKYGTDSIGTVRVSVGIGNSINDINKLINILKKV